MPPLLDLGVLLRKEAAVASLESEGWVRVCIFVRPSSPQEQLPSSSLCQKDSEFRAPSEGRQTTTEIR